MKRTILLIAAVLFVLLAPCHRLKGNTPPARQTSGATANIEWVDIPAGSFMMGSPKNDKEAYPREMPQHLVTLSAFKMSKYEITCAQYNVFCEATGREKTSGQYWCENCPVISITWDDAKAFAEWAGGRLPTEAEWEYACRAGTTTYFNTGDCLSELQANYFCTRGYMNCPEPDNSKLLNKPIPVGSYAPNAWGLYDMHGNVWEWCSDYYGDYSGSEQTNPKGPAAGTEHVVRGGSWEHYVDNCRSAFRKGWSADTRYRYLGFRIVKSN